MDPVWEKLHSSREWGKYPAEDLIRMVMRTFKSEIPSQLHVLELGFGGGANLAFFLNEGFQVYGVDGAPSAVENTQSRLIKLVKEGQTFKLLMKDFIDLPWPDHSFNIVVDHLAIYANRWAEIQKSFAECYRVLKPGGYLYSRSWAQGCDGYKSGEMLEPGTSQNPTEGPCTNMGTSHFFSQEEIVDLFSEYQAPNIRQSTMIDHSTQEQVVEWLVWAQK